MGRLKVLCLLVGLGLLYNDSYGQFFFNFGGPPPPRYRQGPNRNQEKEPEDNSSDPTGYVMVTIGYSQPLGGFASNFGGGYGSYALGGLATTISAGIPVANTNIGVAIMLGNHSNPFNLNAFTQTVAVTSSFYDNYYSIYADNYSENVIMAGLYYTWPIKRLSFDFRAMAGIMISDFPEVTYGADAIWVQNTPQPIQDFQWDYGASFGTSFAYDIGAGIRYRLRRKFCISLNADYLASNAGYNTQLTYTDDYGNQSYTPFSGTIPIKLFSVSLGVGYTFK